MGFVCTGRWIAKMPLQNIPAPTNLCAVVVSPAQISLKWNNNAKNEDGFKIERSSIGSNFIEIGIISANAASYDDNNVEAGITYYYRIKAYEGHCFSTYSNQCFTTIELDAPTNLKLNIVSAQQVKLNWQINSKNEDGFKIERKKDKDYVIIGTVIKGINTFIDNVSDASTYSYRIHAFKTINHSKYSNEEVCTTPLAAPKNLMLSVISISGIKLYWNVENGSTAEGFMIERKTEQDTYKEIGRTTSSNSYTDVHLTEGTIYHYKVRAFKGSNYSDCKQNCAMTGLIVPVCLTATSVSATEVELTWIYNSSSEEGFEIARKMEDGIMFGYAGTIDSLLPMFRDKNLKSGTTYHYKVRAFKQTDYSPFSEEIIVTTK